MKFLCPNCKAKYRIGAEKLVGRQAAKIRCRKCDYRIQIARKPGGDGYEVTATATSVLPGPPGMLNLGAAIRSQGVSGTVEEDDDDDPDDVAPMSAPIEARALPERRALSAPLPPPVQLPPAPLPPPGARAPLVGRPVPRPFAAAQRPAAGAAAQALEGPLAAAAPPMAAPIEAPIARPAPPSPAPSPEEATQAVEKAIEEAGAELPKEDWFVGVNGVPLGPIPLADMCELAVAGHVDRRSLVWREGFDEWKPLGKLPELLRVVDRVAPQSEAPDKLLSAVVPSSLPKMGVPKAPPVPTGVAPAAAGGPPPPPNKTANGASVRPAPFGIPRPGAEPTNKPPISSYTPIEDEDDDEEAPTTVKPRPSTIPEAPGPPPPNQSSRSMQTTQVRAVPLMPPPPGVGGAPQQNQSPSGQSKGLPAPNALPSAAPVPAFPGSNPFPVVRGPMVEAGLPASISATANPLVDEGSDGVLVGPRKSRTRVWILVGVAFVLSVAINAWISSYFSRSEEGEEPGKTLAPAQEKGAEPAPRPAEKSAPDQADEGVEIIDGPPPTAPAPRPTSGGAAKPTGQVAPDEPPVKAGLLAGLNRLGEPSVAGPPSSAPASRGTGGGGLDSAAFQQTVGRYKPSVQRGCWQPALSTKAPGAPSSARVSVSLTVDGAGRVTSVSTGGDPRGYPGLARCIETRVRGWRFPRSSGTTTFAVPFVFAGQ
jgi:predicted Zn finger-like uncharacterized protein